MQVHYNIDQITTFQNAVVTIGTFDGVHSGHRQILNQLNQEAARINGESVIITFHPHPRKIVQAGKSPIFLINTIEEKIKLLDKAGINHLVIVPFTEEFSRLSARQYVEEFLINKFHPHTVIIGYDHHFGKDRGGNYRLLEEYSSMGSFILKEIPEHLIHQSIVSSTAIRKAVLEGDITYANELLGYEFFFEGLIVEGNKLGRTLGYPTANLEINNEEKLIPGNGVYAVLVNLMNHPSKTTGKSALPVRPETIINKVNSPSHLPISMNHSQGGMMNIGIRPTIGGTQRVVEVNIFDFSDEIYGQRLEVSVKKFLRKEQKFKDLDSLKQQLAEDKRQAFRALAL